MDAACSLKDGRVHRQKQASAGQMPYVSSCSLHPSYPPATCQTKEFFAIHEVHLQNTYQRAPGIQPSEFKATLDTT